MLLTSSKQPLRLKFQLQNNKVFFVLGTNIPLYRLMHCT